MPISSENRKSGPFEGDGINTVFPFQGIIRNLQVRIFASKNTVYYLPGHSVYHLTGLYTPSASR